MLCYELNEKILPDRQMIGKMLRSIGTSRRNSNLMKAKLQAAGVDVGKVKSEASAATISDFVGEVARIYRSFEIKRLPKSVGYFLILYIVEEVARAILTNITNAHMADIIMGSLVAPVVEEYAKRLALKRGFGETYVNVFATSEMGVYLLTGGGSLVPRLVAMLYHYFLFTVQKYNMEFSWRTPLVKNDSDPAKKVGFETAMILHSVWNSIASLI